MAVVMKVGAWGAPDGTPQDINTQSRPQRLESITIYSDEVPMGRIFGFSFIYVDQQGTRIGSDIWGSKTGNPNTIEMREGEQLKLVSGSFDDEGIASLKLETNSTEYKTYGYPVQGGEFSLPLPQGKGEVVAFFGRSGVTALKALGVYVKGSPVKVGKWGGKSGAPRDIRPDAEPCKLEGFTVHSSERIYGFSFTYLTRSGQSISPPLWGKINGEEHPVFMNQGEYVSSITGAYDTYGVTFLKFETNQGAKHTFGRVPNPSAGTKTFSVPLPDNGAMDDAAAVAFFGSSGDSLVAIGAYVGVAPE